MSVHTLDSVYTVWHEALQEAVSTRHSILFKRNTISFDRSIDFFEKGSISSGPTGPAVAAIQYNVYVVWSGLHQSSNVRAILYTRSTDGGANFGSTVNLSGTIGPSTFPSIAASGNKVHVVWVANDTTGNNNIFYKRSTDDGANFPSDFLPLSDSSRDSSDPAIAASGNKVHVVWHDNSLGNNNIFYKRSTDDGANFGRPVNLSDPLASTAPAIAASGNNVHVVWVVDFAPEGGVNIQYTGSTDDGANFSIARTLSNTGGTPSAPAIAASGNNVHVVWVVDFAPEGGVNIFYTRSIDGGANFGRPVNLSDPLGDSTAPAIAAAGNNVYVVWVGFSNNLLNIFYKRSTDGGANFGSTVNLSNVTALGGTATPAIAASNNLT
jgi:hypothetical protein